MARKIEKVIIHCTDSDDSLDIGFNEINEWHRQRGWLSPSGISCGSHFIVRRDGRIEKGRPLDEVGAHCKGHNSTSIGIVWVGRKNPSKAQYDSLLNKVKVLCGAFKIPVDKVFGHKEFEPNKTCPNMSMDHVRADLLFVKA
jgi:N-acetylmuramoyl-L-alanine amidase